MRVFGRIGRRVYFDMRSHIRVVFGIRHLENDDRRLWFFIFVSCDVESDRDPVCGVGYLYRLDKSVTKSGQRKSQFFEGHTYP
jgi:hypothetical protein